MNGWVSGWTDGWDADGGDLMDAETGRINARFTPPSDAFLALSLALSASASAAAAAAKGERGARRPRRQRRPRVFCVARRSRARFVGGQWPLTAASIVAHRASSFSTGPVRRPGARSPRNVSVTRLSISIR